MARTYIIRFDQEEHAEPIDEEQLLNLASSVFSILPGVASDRVTVHEVDTHSGHVDVSLNGAANGAAPVLQSDLAHFLTPLRSTDRL